MISQEFIIQNAMGLHARPAATFVKIASLYDAEITVEKDGECVNGKSLMSLLILSAGMGSVLRISANGVDEENAIVELGRLINSKFGEV